KQPLKTLVRFLVLAAIFAFCCTVSTSCAKRGKPSGGPKDTIPPVFVSAQPENYTTHFDSKTIRINFDEYITLDDPDKQILISPRMETKPLIKRQGQASRFVEIEIFDTL